MLNLLPGLGAGDLVTILFENVLPLGNLIVTGYVSPVIRGCTVEHLTGTVGSAGADFAGGFVGQQIGTHIEHCTVSGSAYTVQAENYGGGFAGVVREAEIRGLLDGLGVDLVGVAIRLAGKVADGAGVSQSDLVDEDGNPIGIDTESQSLTQALANTHLQSYVKDCAVTDSNVTVSGRSFLGGFLGAISSSYAVDCTVQTTDHLTLSGTGDCVGGFAGSAQSGWTASLGAQENQEKSLLGLLRQLAVGLLSTHPALGKQLLTIAGASPSAILGCELDCGSVSVHADGSFAGGIAGQGNGLYLGASSEAMFDRLAEWKVRDLLYGPSQSPSGNAMTLSGLDSVTAGADYAGGAAGSIATAAFSCVVNDAVGIGNFIPFVAQGITLTGVSGGYTVQAAGDNAGGGFGSAVGGKLYHVTLSELKQVQSDNRAGGFAGTAGPGGLVGTGCVTLNLLGLNHVLALSNLLSVGQAVAVDMEDCTVTGIDAGFDVEALGQSTTADEITAAGFLAKSHSTDAENAHVYHLNTVTAPAQQGYAGHSEGAQIWGNNTSTWQAENDGNGRIFSTERTGNYTGNQSPCEAVRIRSVYGYEYAGGFTGFMECASTAQTGSIGLLGGLIQANSLVSALRVTYPTEENTAVYGPLRRLDVSTWNRWVDYVGRMRSGVITNGQAYGVKLVSALRSAGGYAGRMETGGAADFSSVTLLGLGLNMGQLVKAAEVFVPAVKVGSVEGYRDGLTVKSGGTTSESFYQYTAGTNGAPGTVSWADAYQDNSGDFIDGIVMTTANNGSAEFTGLEDGTCYLREVEAPTGFNLLTEDIPVVVEHTVDPATMKEIGVKVTSEVPNKKGTLLPNTGSIGT